MFKKGVEFHSRQTLKSKSVQAIKQQLSETYPKLTTDDLERLFPPKSTLTQDTLSNPAKMTMLSVDRGRPLFFHPNHQTAKQGAKPSTNDPSQSINQWIPTVYALWLVPSMLEPVYVPPQVTSYLMSGAELMMPGVLVPIGGYDPPIKVGQLRCVIARGNPAPLAVGVMLVDQPANQTIKMTGKGMKVMHYFGDALYQSSDQSIPNEGFKPNQIHSVMTEDDIRKALEDHKQVLLNKSNDTEADQANNQSTEQAIQNIASALDRINQNMSAAETKVPETGWSEPSDQTNNQQVPDSWDNSPTNNQSINQSITSSSTTEQYEDQEDNQSNNDQSNNQSNNQSINQEPAIDPKEMDELLIESLKYAIKTQLHDDVFPITPSLLLSTYMESCNASQHRLDLKRSSYKKLNKFLKDMQKQGFLHLKQNKEDITIVGAHQQHPDVKPLVITKEWTQALKAKAKRAQQAAAEAAEDNETKDSLLKAERSLHILLRYKVPKSLRFLLADDQSDLMTAQDAKAALWAYTKREGLHRGNNVQMNPDLASALSIKNDSLSKAELAKKFDSALALYHAIVWSADVDIDHVSFTRGNVPCVTAGVEQRQGRKMMSVIQELDEFGIDLNAFVKQAQKWWAASATISEVTVGKTIKRSVLVQGNVLGDIAQRLQQEYGIPPHYIKVNQQATKSKK